jgi:soluble lytic murein transglycosylase-like protein
VAFPACVGPRMRKIWLWNAMFALILVCTNLAGSPVSAQSSDGNMRPQQTRVSKSAPVLDEAENASAAVSPVAGDLSAALVPVSPGPTEPKNWKSDQSCQALENAAAAHDLPLDFFVRLIRQESNFDPNSVSRAGAQGIAQFMPGTARWRGLADPFEPLRGPASFSALAPRVARSIWQSRPGGCRL